MDPYTATVNLIAEIMKANNQMIEAMTPEQRQSYFQTQIAAWQSWNDLLHKLAALLPARTA